MSESNQAGPPPRTRVLLEMRPALEGYAGIPQETRLLFRGLRMLPRVEVEGLIQTYGRYLAKGLPEPHRLFGRELPPAKQINRLSRVVISLSQGANATWIEKIAFGVQKFFASKLLTVLLLLLGARIRLTRFATRNFEDFIWRTLFSKTLPASDFQLIVGANFRICQTPWNVMHEAALNTRSFLGSARYSRLKTGATDVFISQTPFPAHVDRHTRLVVRYHDALPVFMPHTIPNKAFHQATHFNALLDNVRSGAYFACVSQATRADLLKMFPQVEARSIVIHNMVSQHYFEEDSSSERVNQVVRGRITQSIQPKFLSLREQENFYRRNLDGQELRYLLVVSTIEPRKNHQRLLAGWEVLRAELDPRMKLVVVGGLGWDNQSTLKAFRPWQDRGELFVLSEVPAPELRVLYRHAAATVCPSLGEGFDFSGVEAMRSGGLAIASDIPVHREVYGGAAEYFDPYSTMALVGALKKVLYARDPEQARQVLRVLGAEVSSRYMPEKILPKWESFLDCVHAGRPVPTPPIHEQPTLVSGVF
jgi:glycosyltransferase involved in cell wall biosynthesis